MNIITKKSGSSYLTSIIFLVIVIVSTTFLHFYNNSLVIEVEKLKSNISSIESNINDVEKSKSLQIYWLLEINKEIINSYENMNKVTKFINHMNVIQWKYKLNLTGFNLSNWKISSNVNITSDNEGIAYMKTKDFISNYRNDPKALFDLDFISSIEWMDEIKFQVNFKIK